MAWDTEPEAGGVAIDGVDERRGSARPPFGRVNREMTNRAAPSSCTCTGKYRLAAFSHRHSTVRQGTDSREKYSLMVPSTLRYVLVAHMRLTCRRRLPHRGQPPLTLAPVGTDAGLGAPEAPMVRRHPCNSFSDPTQTHLPRAREDATRAHERA